MEIKPFVSERSVLVWMLFEQRNGSLFNMGS